MNKYFRLFSVLLFFVSAGCKNSNDSSEIKNKLFDISAYFSAEAQRLQSLNASLEKTLIKNNISEKLIQKNPNWQLELKPFMESGLNKPAIANSYKIDSVLIGNSLKVTYAAMDSSAPVKNVILYFSDTKPDSIIILKATNTIYYTLSEELRYYRNSYFINASTQPKAGKAIKFSLHCTIQE